MTPNDYLESVLRDQTFAPDSPEVSELQARSEEVKGVLIEKYGSALRLREAGSKKKGTMIRESYDLDLTCYFPHADYSAGDTLREIYEDVAATLAEKYQTVGKESVIRVFDAFGKTDFHVDVVPGRFVENDDGDVFLYRSSADKERLKTNLDIHINHVRESGVIDAIKLMKLWRVRNTLTIKTFVLELLVIKLLGDKKGKGLSDQLVHVWTVFRDDADNLTAEDPANPTGNDLSDFLNDTVRNELSTVAGAALKAIDESGWEAVLGPTGEEDKAARAEALSRIAATTSSRTKPWGYA